MFIRSLASSRVLYRTVVRRESSVVRFTPIIRTSDVGYFAYGSHRSFATVTDKPPEPKKVDAEPKPDTPKVTKVTEVITPAAVVKTKTTTTGTPELTLKQKISRELNHYWHGTKLLGYEIKLSTRLLIKMLSGYELSRRETKQLTTTTSDILRLIPFSVFVIVPFAELLLPVALKVFPNLLPSTYESEADKKKKVKILTQTRGKASDFIRKTVQESGLPPPKVDDDKKKLFTNFFVTLNKGLKPSHEELIQIARCFKNDQVLDNLSRPQLMAMAKYMGLTPYGTDELLRYQIRNKLVRIIQDDRAIDYEGVDSLTIPELKTACASRGIRTSDSSPARLREDLNTWLDLRLRRKIPSVLLILSSTFTYGEHAVDLESYYDALLGVLSSIPDELYNVTKLEMFQDDDKLKLNILKEQDMLIQEENAQSKGIVKNVKDDLKLDEIEEKTEKAPQEKEDVKQ
ncbi:DEKNAAC105450 [Brettanomyces naardenensis]|uniref:DEKNAAC105450 n=1 Tax=Brettanomyces naardenensis TaxID=13370 RepID=A0A448YT87_BRENA|nr:DEKNAAC105450 [Brettanomyces naardenensis]